MLSKPRLPLSRPTPRPRLDLQNQDQDRDFNIWVSRRLKTKTQVSRTTSLTISRNSDSRLHFPTVSDIVLWCQYQKMTMMTVTSEWWSSTKYQTVAILPLLVTFWWAVIVGEHLKCINCSNVQWYFVHQELLQHTLQWNRCTHYTHICTTMAFIWLLLTTPPLKLRFIRHIHTQLFYSPFSGITRVSRCQKKAPSKLHGAREDKRQTHHSSGLAPLHQD